MSQVVSNTFSGTVTSASTFQWLKGMGNVDPANNGWGNDGSLTAPWTTVWESWTQKIVPVHAVWTSSNAVTSWSNLANGGSGVHWSSCVNPAYVHPSIILVHAFPMIPKTTDTGQPGGRDNTNGLNPAIWDHIKNGGRDSEYTAMANSFKSDMTARQDPTGSKLILRLGWEQNGTWYPWSVEGNISGWQDSWNRITARIKDVLPDVRFEVQVAKSRRRTDPDQYFPTDNVDNICVSCHDSAPHSVASPGPGDPGTSPASKDTFQNAHVNPVAAGYNYYGLDECYAEVVRRNGLGQVTGFSLSEWATQFNNNAGGNFPPAPEPSYFIQSVWDWLDTHQTYLSHDTYFDNSCCRLRSQPDIDSPSSVAIWNAARNLYKSLWQS